MARFTTFRFCLNPTGEQEIVLRRHAGAARFGYNQCLRLVKDALDGKRGGTVGEVPWSGFDLINAFNGWKRSGDAGRVMVAAGDGTVTVQVTGLAWRGEVCQQVFEEAAVGLGRGLSAYTASRTGHRRGRRVGFPRFKSKKRAPLSFRIRSRTSAAGRAGIRVGEHVPRTVTLPGIGALAVRQDTRRVRRMLAEGRAKVVSATVSHRAGRWAVSLTCDAADLHDARRHEPNTGAAGWVGVDRGLSTFVAAARADGTQVLRVDGWPRPARAAVARQRRLSRKVTRKQRGSNNRAKAAARLGRHHARLASAVADAAWGELARQLAYKQQWRAGQLALVDRWYPSTKTCSACRTVAPAMPLHQRTFTCQACGYQADRDHNAAVNLAVWAEQHHAQVRDLPAGGPVTNAGRGEGSGPRTRAGETSPDDAGTAPTPPGARRGRPRRALSHNSTEL